MINNPFIISGYVDAKYFCGREYETRRLISLLTNGNNVVLTSHRRIGKTDLIHHVFAQKEIKKDYITILVDAYPTKNMSEFIAAFGKAVCDALKPRGKKAVDKFVEFLSSLRSELTFDFHGWPVWGFGIGQGIKPEATLDEIFQYLNSSPAPCIVAIDEFQQITTFPNGDSVEALLRSYIQRSPFTRFIFAGSQRHIMAELFTSPARPFFQSSTLLGLPLIPKEEYVDFCKKLFETKGRTISASTIEAIYDRFDGITAYMHKVMNELYLTTPPKGKCQPEDIEPAINNLITDSKDSYSSLFYQMTERQRELFLAIVREGKVKNLQSADFVRRHNLFSQSTVAATAKALLEKDIITRDEDTYMVYDRFFALWARRSLLNIQ